MAELSILSQAVDSDRFVLIRSFFDGSGKEGKHNPKSITLAGFCGKATDWEGFESAWQEALLEHKAPLTEWGTPYWHSREAFHGIKGYRRFNERQTWSLVVDLMKAVHAHSLGSIFRFGVTVDLADFRQFKRENPGFRQSPKHIILDWCLMSVCQQLKHQGISDPSIEWVFDDDEPYEPVLRKAMRHGLPIRKCTSAIYPERAQRLYPLQACDLLAWSLNRYDSQKPKFNWNQIAAGFFAMGWFRYTHYDLKCLYIVFDEKGRYRDKTIIPSSGFWGTLDMLEYWLEVFGKKPSE
jgi:hypothetical protein